MARQKRSKNEYDEGDGFVEAEGSKKKVKSAEKVIEKPDGHVDEDGNQYWEISPQRRVQISEFKGATLINIREFYEKDGRALPGKKGISLSVDQYITLLTLLPEIEAALKKKGEIVPRPNYNGNSGDDVKDEPVDAVAAGDTETAEKEAEDDDVDE